MQERIIERRDIIMNNMFIKDLHIKWEDIGERSYIRGIPAIASIDELSFHKPVTFFVGENGTGKSTLLEAIAVNLGFNPEGGTKNYSFSTYDSHSDLCDAIRLIKGCKSARNGYFLRAESFYNVATAEDEYSRGIGGKPMHYHERSHGESFLALVRETFQGNGIYLLDEPEAALSSQRQLTLMIEIRRCVEAGAQFIIVTHSPILLGFPDADILSFDGGSITPISYEETQSYQITKMFINDRRQILRHLLEE
jgi:predicted ATPase